MSAAEPVPERFIFIGETGSYLCYLDTDGLIPIPSDASSGRKFVDHTNKRNLLIASAKYLSGKASDLDLQVLDECCAYFVSHFGGVRDLDICTAEEYIEQQYKDIARSMCECRETAALTADEELVKFISSQAKRYKLVVKPADTAETISLYENVTPPASPEPVSDRAAVELPTAPTAEGDPANLATLAQQTLQTEQKTAQAEHLRKVL